VRANDFLQRTKVAMALEIEAREDAAVTVGKSNAIILRHCCLQQCPAVNPANQTVSIDEAQRIFDEALARGEFRIQQCRDCGMFALPPAGLCPHCASTALRWTEPSGRGIVHSIALPVGLGANRDESAVQPPLVLVELEEGPRLAGRVIDVDARELRPGLPVSVHIGLIEGRRTLVFYNKEQGSREW
jgi:uncharacterized OB-fold protein